jgi:GNAT superfamily N-acetyltransferase
LAAPLIRIATSEDTLALKNVMDRAIAELQADFLSPAEIEASQSVMGLDTRLIADGTYFAAIIDGEIAGCGGWSRRATLYGGDHTPGREPALLDPATEAARVRAMYTNPDFTRRGVGRAVLDAAEAAARAEGFLAVELAATMGGLPLYRVCGYRDVEAFEDDRGGVAVPLVRMRKPL